MKIAKLAALSGLVLTSAVYAQSTTIYGMIDTGVEAVSNVNGVGTLTRMPSTTGILPSRLGFRGKEDLGGGLSAIYTLEMGFGPDTGASGQGGRLFGRQSTVGFSGDWGAVTLGRQWTMLFWSVLDSDIVGPAVYGLGSLDSYIPNSRIDNSIAYKGKFGNVTVGGTYSLGRDAVNAGPSPAGTNCPGESGTDTSACREWSAMVKYDTSSWGTALGYDTMNGRTVGAAPDAVFAGMTSSSKSDSRLMLNGYMKFGGAKVSAGLISRTNDGAAANKSKSDLWYLGASYPLTTAWTIDGTYAMLRYKDVSNNDASLLAVRALYAISKQTTLYAQMGLIENDSQSNISVSGGAPGSNPALGGSQTGVMFGVNHRF
ncbi:porin [Rhodoferax sp.]|uniref:porin n=1 Tax=Rhodoferax sp. TaxID=50421 RepID=UPI0028419B59|nr:porin [Rhodoferax sp.]MDR3368186.1 porin [Rhodoferax sp.]